MKDKFTITISNVKGVQQYTYEQIVRIIVKWLILALLLLGLIGWGLYKVLSLEPKADTKKIDHLKELNIELKKNNLLLKNENKDLLKENKILTLEVNKQVKLYSEINHQLAGLEKFVGLNDDTNKTAVDKINQIQDAITHKLQKSKKAIVVQLKASKPKKKFLKIDKKIAKSVISILNKKVPNGKPVKMYKIISPYGYRIHPITKHMEFHPGIDLAVPVGTPVYAMADGVIEYAKNKGAYGKYILINHSYGFKSVYAHLNDFACGEGKYIKKGEIIAYSGNSGKSIQPHLHYEIRYLNKWLNPKPFLASSPKSLKALEKRNNMVNWTGIINQIKKD